MTVEEEKVGVLEYEGKGEEEEERGKESVQLTRRMRIRRLL